MVLSHWFGYVFLCVIACCDVISVLYMWFVCVCLCDLWGLTHLGLKPGEFIMFVFCCVVSFACPLPVEVYCCICF